MKAQGTRGTVSEEPCTQRERLAAFLREHAITDQVPRRACVAIGLNDWMPPFDYPPLRSTLFIVRPSRVIPASSKMDCRRAGHLCVREMSHDQYVLERRRDCLWGGSVVGAFTVGADSPVF